jgi:hypothetical protein
MSGAFVTEMLEVFVELRVGAGSCLEKKNSRPCGSGVVATSARCGRRRYVRRRLALPIIN